MSVEAVAEIMVVVEVGVVTVLCFVTWWLRLWQC